MFSTKTLDEKTLLTIGVPDFKDLRSIKNCLCLFLGVCLLLVTLNVAQSQVIEEWVKRYNGPGNLADSAYAITVDDTGNVYVTGASHGGGSEEDYATAKYNAAGNELWVKRYNGPVSSDDYGQDIALDDSGNVYVTGTINGGVGWQYDYGTIKYDNNGNQLWVKRYDGAGRSDSAKALALDSSGKVYVTGNSKWVGASDDYATIKYDNNGTQLWVRRYDGPINGEDRAVALVVDDANNVYITQIWVLRYDGPGNDWDKATAIAVDDASNVYVTGESHESGASLDYATIKYSQEPPPPATLVCKTDKSSYNPWERVQVLADVDNPGSGFTANLLGGIIVLRPLPKKPLLLTGNVITKTIEPGLNPNIPLYVSMPAITGLIAPEGTHGAFGVLYTGTSILAIDAGTWGLKGPPSAVKENFVSDFIQSYIKRYGIENLKNANADIPLPAPASDAPVKNALGPPFPSIANPETWFPFQLSRPSEVTITIHNASGQLVKTLNLGYKQSGHYLNKAKAACWNGKNERGERVASGIYFYTMQTRNFTATGKVVILK